MRLSRLFNLKDGVRLEKGNKDLIIRHLTSDSRNVRKGSLFAAISGNLSDGHNYIDSAIKNGAVAILGDGRDLVVPDNIMLLRSDNVRGSFASACAKFWPSRPGFTVAVTGTNGKTSTVEFLRQIWERNTWNALSLGTLGARSTTLLNIPSSGLTTPSSEYFFSALDDFSKQGLSYLAVEASSHGLEQQRIYGLKVQVAVFTNLDRDHLDYHANIDAYFESKQKLFLDYVTDGGHAVINIDDTYGKKLFESVKKQPLSIITFGKDSEADFRIETIEPTGYGLELNVIFRDKKYTCPLGLTGYFQAENALAAAVSAYLSGLPVEIALRSLSFLSAIDGRMQPIYGHPKDALIVIDYAHTPDALEQVLLSLKNQTKKKVHVVFGCGGQRDKGKRILMGRVAHRLADKITITDDNPRNESPGAIRAEIMAGCPNAIEVGNRDEAIEFAIQQLQNSDSLLIAGKGHESLQLIGSETLPFSDAVVARNVVKRLNDVRQIKGNIK